MDIFEATEVEGECVSVLLAPEYADSLFSHLLAKGAVAWRSAPHQRLKLSVNGEQRRMEPRVIIEVGLTGTLADLMKLTADWSPPISN